LFFAYALGHILLAAMRLGATVVLHSGWPAAEDIAQIIAHRNPKLVFTVPTLYRNLLREGFANQPGFAAVENYISAGEHLPETLFDQWADATGRPLLDCIGATENLVLFIGNRPDDYLSGASGVPMPHTQVRLTTDDGVAVEEPDAPGILWVRTDTIAAGYWGQDDLTKAAFKDGWYCTNDVFIRDADGRYYYQGRSDDMLKISGQWVSPAEIEVYVNRNPHVAEGVVVGVENKDGLIRLALCLVPTNADIDRAAFEAELTQDLTSKLSIYKCPRRFVYVDQLPLTATGKVQRFKVREIVSADIAGA
jgi:benzoate-CoA ligase